MPQKALPRQLLDALSAEAVACIERFGEAAGSYNARDKYFVIFDFAMNPRLLEEFRKERGSKDGQLSEPAKRWLAQQNAARTFRGRVFDRDPLPPQEDDGDYQDYQLPPITLHEYITPDGRVYIEDIQEFHILPNNCYLAFLAIRLKGKPDSWVEETTISEEQIRFAMAANGPLW